MSRSKFIFLTHLPVFPSWLFPSATLPGGILTLILSIKALVWYHTCAVFFSLCISPTSDQPCFSLFLCQSDLGPTLFFTFFMSVRPRTYAVFLKLCISPTSDLSWFSQNIYQSDLGPALISSNYISVRPRTYSHFHFLCIGQYVYRLCFPKKMY